MKLKRSIVIPITVVLCACLLGVFLQKWPLIIVIANLAITIITVYDLEKGEAIGKLFLHAILFGLIYAGLVLLIAYLARSNESLLKLLLFPFYNELYS
ncbi:MAG: hypothetical protein IJC18_03525 [Clostridia bacterium]|nr:hypothetical protein [Clostridia bacterium]